MIDINEFVDEHGRIDLPAYRQAQRDTGEVCYRCAGVRPEPHLAPAFCEVCKAKDSDQFISKTFVRCPHCGTVTEPSHRDAGEYDVACPSCNNHYHYHVQLYFTSI